VADCGGFAGKDGSIYCIPVSEVKWNELHVVYSSVKHLQRILTLLFCSSSQENLNRIMKVTPEKGDSDIQFM